MTDRIEKLRTYMKEKNIAATVIPTADMHLSEYICDYYKLRQWLSGFTGSAGELVVTLDESGLWTDGRYYIQAEKELRGSTIKLYKASEKDCIKINDYLKSKLKKRDTVGFDGSLFSKNKLDETLSELKKSGIKAATDFNPGNIWKDRPSVPHEKLFVFPSKYCGKSLSEKLEIIRSQMKKEGFTHYIVSTTECVMWLLNIRGKDICHTPTALTYLLISLDDIVLYVDKNKVENVEEYLKSNSVHLRDYNAIYIDLQHLDKSCVLAADYSLTNYNLVKAINCEHKDRKDFIYNFKAVKTDIEIENIKKAYIKENIALVKSFYKIYHTNNLTECDVADIIEDNRKKMQDYFSPSFTTIAAFGKNAAMMHYSPTRDACAKIEKNGLLLIDTGGQYFEGTTDTTRTLCLGEITDEQAENFTLVLKGNISLLTAVFPDTTTGENLDALARMPLWKKGLDYRCGTGHGVGFFLGVHEGPTRISPSAKERLLPNMTVTDEPGVYIEGEYGIRIENHLAVKKFKTTDCGNFLCFEVLNYCPIGTRKIVAELLDENQRHWLNSYNKKCREILKPFLTEEEHEWLKTYTAEI